MYYPEELIEEVRTRNDIVEVISGYVRLQKKEVTISGCVRSITKSRLPFPYPPESRCIIVSAAVRAAM